MIAQITHTSIGQSSKQRKNIQPTSASWSKRPNSSFNILTNSGAVHSEARGVKLTISAYRILKINKRVMIKMHAIDPLLSMW